MKGRVERARVPLCSCCRGLPLPTQAFRVNRRGDCRLGRDVECNVLEFCALARGKPPENAMSLRFAHSGSVLASEARALGFRHLGFCQRALCQEMPGKGSEPNFACRKRTKRRDIAFPARIFPAGVQNAWTLQRGRRAALGREFDAVLAGTLPRRRAGALPRSRNRSVSPHVPADVARRPACGSGY